MWYGTAAGKMQDESLLLLMTSQPSQGARLSLPGGDVCDFKSDISYVCCPCIPISLSSLIFRFFNFRHFTPLFSSPVSSVSDSAFTSSSILTGFSVVAHAQLFCTFVKFTKTWLKYDLTCSVLLVCITFPFVTCLGSGVCFIYPLLIFLNSWTYKTTDKFVSEQWKK